MNADILRQRKAANGKLFDVNGNSSLGELPRGNLVVKGEFIRGASANTNSDFTIGAVEHTQVFDTKNARQGLAQVNTIDALNDNPAPNNFLAQGMMNPVKEI